MNRRLFLRNAFAAVPVIVAGEQLIELLVPKRTIFLPPRGVWRAFWLYGSIDSSEIDFFDFDDTITGGTESFSVNYSQFDMLDAKARVWDSRYFPSSRAEIHGE